MDYTKLHFKSQKEIIEFENMVRTRLYNGKMVKIVGNFALPDNKWKIKIDNQYKIVPDDELIRVYNDSDFDKFFRK